MAGVKNKLLSLAKQYRIPLIALLLGIVLMLLPSERKPETPAAQEPTAAGLQEQLEGILSQVRGAGKVRVLLTESEGERIRYQINEATVVDGESTNTRLDTVTVTDAGRAQNGLITQVEPPVYLGALVICQGADSAAIRLAMVEAVASVTGLSTDRITVLKMK